MMLLRNPKVRYVAYRKPHPLENKIEIKIQTNGDITPLRALRDALKNLNDDIDDCVKNLDEEFQVNKNNTIVVGHQVMTCCAADIQFLGYEVILPNKMELVVGDYVRLTAKVIKHYSNIAREEVIMLDASKVQLLPAEKEKVLSF